MNKASKIFIIFTLLIFGASLFLPNEFTVEKSIMVKANKEQIYPYISDLKLWPKWVPWQNEGEDMKISYGKISKGKGASQRWKGEDGAGRLIITEANPDKGITYVLYFDNFPEKNLCYLNFEQQGDELKVIWKMDGIMSYPILGKFMVVLFKPVIADMYEDGLKNLKALLEQGE